MEVEGEMDTETNFAVQQVGYREQAERFFSDPGRYERLRRIVVNGDKMCSAVFFFVKEYEKGSLVQTKHKGIYCICDEYKNAITNHKKRYYNFESKEGKGELRWQGMTNPRVLVNAKMGSISLPLPRLVALQWFIQYDFDLLFWDNKEVISRAFVEFTSSVKRRYTEAHKNKKREARARMEKEVIQKRNPDEPNTRKGKKSVYLTRTERQMVARLLDGERLKHKKQRVHPPKTTADKRGRETRAPIITDTINGEKIALT